VARLETGDADVRVSTLERYAAAIGSQLAWQARAQPSAGPDPAGPGPAGADPIGPGLMGADPIGPGLMGPGNAQAGFPQGGRPGAGLEQEDR
jgi:hypothetical protein